MLMMQKTLHNIQMEENVIGYCDMLAIHRRGRRLLIFILSLEVILEILYLVLQLMEWVVTVT